MTEPEIDLMDVDRSKRLGRAFHDTDGTDWRLDPHDDEAVRDALHPDAEPEHSEEEPCSGS